MIKIENLTKTYKNNVTALDNVSMNVNEGDIFGIIGMSGAGKSTLLKIIGMLEQPTKGKIEVLNQDVSNISATKSNSIKKNIGTVFQGFNLLMQRNVKRNIAFPLELAKKDKKYIDERCEQLCRLVGLSEKLNSYPSQLSGGQKQRVAIARALATNPKILLCDEPTSALDSFTTKEILKLLKNINESLGVTIIIITHEIGVVKAICNRTTVLNESKIAEQGETKSILSNPQNLATKLLLGVGGEI